MKNLTIFIMLVMLVSFLVGCGGQPVEMDPEQEAYQAEMQTRLAELEQNIQSLREEAQQLDNNEVGLQLVQIADNLETRRIVVNNQVDQLSTVEPEVWEDMKFSIDTSVQELEQAYEQASVLLEQNS